MLKTRLFSFLLSLSLFSACQAPVQTTNPDGSLTKQEYGRRFVSLYKDFNKSAIEGVKSSGIVLGASQASAPLLNVLVPASVPTTPSSSTPAAGTLPSASPASPASAVPSAQQLELMKALLQAGLKSSAQMETRLKALTPPPELAEKHTLLLDYFGSTRDFADSILKDLETSDPTALSGLEGKYKDKLERLKALQPQVMTALYEFNLDGYRQERVALQQGGMLSKSEYFLKMRSLISKLPSGTGDPSAALVESLKPVSNTVDQKPDVKALMTQAKTSLEKTLGELASIHPPEAYEEGHTAIYASGRLNVDLMVKMTTFLAGQGDLEQLAKNPLTLMTALLADVELLEKMNDLALFMPKSSEALSRIVKG